MKIKSAFLAMFVGTLLGGIVSIPLIRYMTIPAMSWKFVFQLCGSCMLFILPVFSFLGYMQDRDYRRKQGIEMLKKFEKTY